MRPMRPTINLAVKGEGAKGVASRLLDLTSRDVLVGIPGRTTSRRSNKGQQAVTNAELAFLHTHGVRTIDARRRMGAMMKNRGIGYNQALALYLHSKGSLAYAVPPRPIIEPAIVATGNKEKLAEDLRRAAQANLSGQDVATVERYLTATGLDAQNIVRRWFTDPRNGWPPNKPSTIRRKGSAQPLIDTGELRKSMTFVIRKGKGAA